MGSEYKPMTTQLRKALIKSVLDKLNLREKASLLSGKDNWATVNIDELGIKSAIVTDGPHGVRHPMESGRGHMTSTYFPTGVSFASSWSPELVKKVGVALGEETRATGCDVLLGPCVNIIRHPLAGRNFESYSEDPYHAGKIGVAYIDGVQKTGIGTSLKHFALNSQEIERGRGNSVCDERTMREIYLSQFEMIVKESQPWTVMCSYNKINGKHASQNRKLLTEILRDEWGFEGLVMSDWGATHAIIEALEAGLDLEMPGPAKYYKHLHEAVIDWKMDPKYIEQGAERVLDLLAKVGKFGDAVIPEGSNNTFEHGQLAKQLAAESITLLKNEGNLLPIDESKVKSIAVIGQYADKEVSGGGSSRVVAPYIVTPMDALNKNYGDKIDITHYRGCSVSDEPESLEALDCTHDGGIKGLKSEHFDNIDFKGVGKVGTRQNLTFYCWNGPKDFDVESPVFSARWSGNINVERTSNYLIKVGYTNQVRIIIDGKIALDKSMQKNEDSWIKWDQVSIPLEAGSHSIKVEYIYDGTTVQAILHLLMGPSPDPMDDETIAHAVAAAQQSDYAIVFGSMPFEYESEGRDRPNMLLPGRQNELIERVAAVNPNTIVVLNTGVAIEMPWVKKVSAIVEGYYYGQEGGNALADILFGKVNPSGKLSQTFPNKLQETPAYINYPGYKDVFYGEGLFVGYRYYDYKDMDVLFPFGHGLSYSTFKYSEISCPDTFSANDGLKISIEVTNESEWDGQEVVQLYVRDVESTLVRPVKELKGFKKVLIKAGETAKLEFNLDYRSFAYYDPYESKWVAEQGDFEILIGSSSRDIRASKLARNT